MMTILLWLRFALSFLLIENRQYEVRAFEHYTTSVTTYEMGMVTKLQTSPTCHDVNDIKYDIDYPCEANNFCPQVENPALCDGDVTKRKWMYCFNTSSSESCMGRTDCKEDSFEIHCESSDCLGACTFCKQVPVLCDIGEGKVNSSQAADPLSTTQYMRLENISANQCVLPISEEEFPHLKILDISGNLKPVLRQCYFPSMPNLHYLNLTGSSIEFIETGAFRELGGLIQLDLHNNKIQLLSKSTFRKLTFLRTLVLRNNSIAMIEAGAFQGLENTVLLSLSDNKLTELHGSMLDGLSSIKKLSFRRNHLSNIAPGTFAGLTNLERLYLENNDLIQIQREHFTGLKSLVSLNLGHNKLQTISAGTFQDLNKLVSLILLSNSISIIEKGAFKGLNELEFLSLTNNELTDLRAGALDGMPKVEWISLRSNPLSYIEPGSFDNLTNLKYLEIVRTNLRLLEPDMFRGIPRLYFLFTDDYRLCCLIESWSCSQAQTSALDSCSRLMPNTVLRISLWLLGLGALIGNTMVLLIRCYHTRAKGSSHQQTFFISNLAIADWIMGVFMLIVASADVFYGEYYYLHAPLWRSSIFCRFAGAIAIMSSESSVFLLTLVTVDRFVSIVFPFSSIRFHLNSARVCVAITWVITFILSLGPIIIGIFVPGFYGLSDVCIGLPLSVDSLASGPTGDGNGATLVLTTVDNDSKPIKPSWVYSIVLFLGVNLFCFLFILICYIVIFIQARRSARRVGKHRTMGASRDQEVRMAAKMAIIVGTDFCCWMPVIIMGIISQTGLVQIPVSLYAWSAVFILPINSTLNPYLYTFTEFFGKKKKTDTTTASQKSVKTQEMELSTANTNI